MSGERARKSRTWRLVVRRTAQEEWIEDEPDGLMYAIRDAVFEVADGRRRAVVRVTVEPARAGVGESTP